MAQGNKKEKGKPGRVNGTAQRRPQIKSSWNLPLSFPRTWGEGILRFFELLPLDFNLTFSTMLYFRLFVVNNQQIVDKQQKGAV